MDTQSIVLIVFAMLVLLFLVGFAVYSILTEARSDNQIEENLKMLDKINREKERQFLLNLTNDILIEEDYFQKLLDWADINVLSDLPDYLLTYYVMYDLYDSLCETGINEFFVNARFYDGRESQTYLLQCCKSFGSRKLTRLCKKALAIEKKYKISEQEDWPEACKKALEKLDEKIYKFDEKYSLGSMIDEYFARNYIKNPGALQILLQPTFAQIFCDRRYSDYDVYTQWCYDKFRQYDRALNKNPTLFGACVAMWYNRLIQKGGLELFWEQAKQFEWDLEKIKVAFEKLLPTDLYQHYVNALKAYQDGQNYQQLDAQYNAEKMSKEVIPQLATKVGDYYRKQATRTTK